MVNQLLAREDEELLNCVRRELGDDSISFESAIDTLLSDYQGVASKLFPECEMELLIKNGGNNFVNKRAVATKHYEKPVVVKCGYEKGCRRYLHRDYLYDDGISKKSSSARTEVRRIFAMGMAKYRESLYAYIFTPEELDEELGIARKISLR